MNIKIGKKCEINLEKLIATRLLINANSGGGKSYLIRRLMEQSHGKVQQILIDLEGEFSTLREKFDYLLVGKDGEIPVSIRSADLLARKLLELNVSTIIDLSELKHPERITFVKRFLDSLINSPQTLWHPCMILIDEAHQFCPQASSSESMSSVIDLMTRGRKRGFCGVLSTQRISKLHKDAAAEANNIITGRTGLDIDQKRAGEILGFTEKKEIRGLRDLKEGEFYMFGSAFNHYGVEKHVVGSVQTTHPDRTKGILIKEPSKTPENIKKVLKDVVDLPKEAEEEIRTLTDYKNKVRELRTKITILEKSKPEPQIDERKLEVAKKQGFREAEKQYQSTLLEYRSKTLELYKKLETISRVMGSEMPEMPYFPDIKIQEPRNPVPITLPTKMHKPEAQNIHHLQNPPVSSGDLNLGLAEKKIYSLLCQYPDKIFSKSQIGVFTGYSHTSGGFNNALSRLKTNDLIIRNGNQIQVKQINPELTQEFDFSKEAIINKLGKCEREIYQVLLDNPYEEFTLEVVAGMTPSNYSYSSGGFNNAISRLNTFGLIERNKGVIRLNPELLEI